MQGQENKKAVSLIVEKKSMSDLSESQIELMQFAMRDAAIPLTSKSDGVHFRSDAKVSLPKLFEELTVGPIDDAINSLESSF